MEIFLVIKGFVTNSSSANYWLNDEVLKDEKLKAYLANLNSKKTENTTPDPNKEILFENQTISQNNLIKETTANFFIWFSFSTILIIIMIIKNLHQKYLWPKLCIKKTKQFLLNFKEKLF